MHSAQPSGCELALRHIIKFTMVNPDIYPKAFIRSGLWDTSRHMPADELPTLGRMILEQINGEPPSKELQDNIDKALDEDSRDNLY